MKNFNKIILILLVLILYSCEKSEPVNPTVYINESNFSFGFDGFSWDSTNDDYYHSKYCEKLSENYITMTLTEARQEGYTQCPNCNAISDIE